MKQVGSRGTRPIACAVLLVVTACGGGSGRPAPPAAPTPTPTPTPPANTWSVAGQVVTTGSAQAVSGATVTPAWSLAAVTTDAGGSYQLGDTANPPSTPYQLTISGAGLISHDVWVTWARGPRNGVTLDVIRDGPPFSMD